MNGAATSITRESRVELLVASPVGDLTALADAVLADGAEPEVLVEPEVGMVVLTVREPVEAVRFHLAEVLVTRAEVAIDGHRGWAMRMGDDRVATLAAALLDATVEAGHPRAGEVIDLCRRTSDQRARARADEWAELAPTIVDFEEMD